MAKECYEPFNHSHSDPTLIHDDDGDEDITFAQIRKGLFPSSVDSRWAASADVQEPDCVSFQNRDLGGSPVDNVRIVNDQPEDNEAIDDYHRLSEQDVDSDELIGGLFEYSVVDPTVVEVTLQARHLSRRERTKHHHHSQQKNPQKEKRDFNPVSPSEKNPVTAVKIVAEQMAPMVAIRADDGAGQSVYTLNNHEDAAPAADVILRESLSHSETTKAGESVPQAAGGDQKVLVQGGTGAVSPETASESLGKANAGHPVDTNGTASATAEEGESHPKKGTVLLAAVPILLLMGAIAGFTVYRRYYENNFNQGGRNDRDDLPGDGYHRRGKYNENSLVSCIIERVLLSTLHANFGYRSSPSQRIPDPL